MGKHLVFLDWSSHGKIFPLSYFYFCSWKISFNIDHVCLEFLDHPKILYNYGKPHYQWQFWAKMKIMAQWDHSPYFILPHYKLDQENIGNESVYWYLSKFFFKKIEIYSMQGWTATMIHGVTRKRSAKRLKHTGNLFRKNLQIRGVC